MRRWVIAVVVMVVGLAGLRLAYAHANLERAEPSPNATLMQPPGAIRLWFTEPLESGYSGISLFDANGNKVETPPATVDENDARQLNLLLDDLPDGVYTVSWRALSSADGHATTGSYAFRVGMVGETGTASQVVERVPGEGAFVRWFNLLTLSLAVGSVGFWLFVWNPCQFGVVPDAERRMSGLMWFGWILSLGASVFLLMLQLSVASGESIFHPVSLPAVADFIGGTRFGSLWMARMALLLAMGAALLGAERNRRLLWLALALGVGVLLTNSLFSHASVAVDRTPAIAGDWLHLTMTALWVGGLVQFVNVLGSARRATTAEVSASSTLVMHFSNYGRVAVAALIVTGIYSAWLQVGSVEGLLTTTYGQALLVKIALILPLLVIAAINFVYTARGLRAGQVVWARRLRGLVGVEIALVLGVLAAVGVMTSINPARGVIAARNAAPTQAAADYFEYRIADGMHIHLAIAPAQVGTNTFTVDLYDESNAQVEGASVRLRFQSLDQRLGEGNLRLEPQTDGTYAATSDNLSVPGAWRVRAMIQRPGAYDTVVDFEPEIAPLPPSAQPIDPQPPLSDRSLALVVTGMLALIIGGFFAGRSRAPLWRGMGLLATSVVVVGMVFLVSGVMVG